MSKPTKPWGVADQDRDTWTHQYPPIHHHSIYPWTVLDTRTSEWKNLRQFYEQNIPDSTQGRDNTLYAEGKSGYHASINNGRSKFDAALTGLMYQWYTGENSQIYDPFAGGVTRGAIATMLGHTYTGVDINLHQIMHNQQMCPNIHWICGDGCDTHMPAESMDMVLTCPPYHAIEKYTTHPQDLSNMRWGEHLEAVQNALHECYSVLKSDRYLVWVIGDLRSPTGELRLLPHKTATRIEKAGFTMVNEHILINPVGTRHRMLRRWWSPTRSAGRLHQHVLVAVKGDRRKAADWARRQPHC